jgi:ribosomal protein S18 acetylase RimI-like enzyme
MIEAGLEVRPITDSERPHVAQLLTREWGSTEIISHGQPYDALRYPPLVCVAGDRIVGLATYYLEAGEYQVLTLNAFEKLRGIGSRLLEALIDRANAEGCRRLWLVTSNDNLDAIRFYQRRGLRLVAVYPGAIDEERRTFKPETPLVGNYGIRIRDEVEFEIDLRG